MFCRRLPLRVRPGGAAHVSAFAALIDRAGAPAVLRRFAAVAAGGSAAVSSASRARVCVRDTIQ